MKLRLRWLGVGRTTLAIVLASGRVACAVSPLVTDDADTVDPGHLQLNAGWQYARSGGVTLQSAHVNPVLAVSSRGEVGVTFGYQSRDGRGSGPLHGDADGITDLTLATKWRIWHPSPDGFRVSARLDLKIPTASERRGFGTGEVDVGTVVIATRDWPRASLDWNVGYTVIDASGNGYGDDGWFLGQAVRHQATTRWTIIGEGYAILPNTTEGGSPNGHFTGGAQLSLHPSLVLSALIGTAVGDASPDLTGYVGFTWTL
jgi:hypothetical protein